jgi:peptide chain release factor 2
MEDASRSWSGFSDERFRLAVRLRLGTCQRPTASRSTSACRRSGPSSPGSVITFDPDALAARRSELEKAMGEPDFWDDQSRAARVSTEHARVSRKLDRYESLRSEYEDAQTFLELGEDEAAIAEMVRSLEGELDRVREDALFTGRYDAGDAVLEIHAGTGGTDAQDWAEMLLRMYERWAGDRGFEWNVLEASPGEEAGLKSATIEVKGENAYGTLKAERGVHRLVRLSPFDSAHRRHTAFAQVVVAPLLPDDVGIEIDESDLRIDTYRSSGAGGQHVNKTDSAVRITHLPTGIVVQCQNERSQTSNKATAMRILKSRLAELEEEKREAELARERGAAQDIGFGSQIRSYVLHPYQLVKDHRTDYEVGNTQSVLDGGLDGFVHAYLLAKAAGQVV